MIYKRWDRSLTLIKPLTEKTTVFPCGHSGPEEIEVVLYGEVVCKGKTSEITRDASLCPNCILDSLKEDSIQCCLCGGAVLPGEGVSLCRVENLKKGWATYVGDRVIGCLACCTGGGFMGHWTEEGFKPAYKNGYSLVDGSPQSPKAT